MDLKLPLCFIIVLIAHGTYSQVQKKIREYEKGFQVSLFPGICTNGIYSASYFNKVSLNLFGGLSAGNHVLEVGILTNTNTKSSTGIQLAGLANVVGVNAFMNLSLPEERELINKENFESNTKGIQLAGLLNFVRTHASGIQVAGLLNVVGGDIRGLQIAGIGNSSANNTNGFSTGLQLAGLYNVSRKSMGGFQITTIFNYTNGEIAGAQLALINKARVIKGRHTMPPIKNRGLQIGLINHSKEMDGLQIGLINFGGKALGKQIGLINFFEKYPTKENVRKNTPVGLLNFGSKGSVFRISFNEVFPFSIEYSTGNCLNCSLTPSEMPFNEGNQIFNQNALILGFDPFQDSWGFGYGFMKVYYNKSSMLPQNPRNRSRMLSYGVRFLHLNPKGGFDKTFNLLSKLHVELGKRVRGHYIFIGASLNYYLCEATTASYHVSSSQIETGDVGGMKSQFWPGYTVGFQL